MLITGLFKNKKMMKVCLNLLFWTKMIKNLKINNKKHLKFLPLLKIYQILLKAIIVIQRSILITLRNIKINLVVKLKKNNKEKKVLALINNEKISYLIIIYYD